MTTTKPCTYCNEWIAAHTRICPHCDTGQPRQSMPVEPDFGPLGRMAQPTASGPVATGFKVGLGIGLGLLLVVAVASLVVTTI